MSSRGWYEIVTAKDYSYLNSEAVVEACLNCKSCRTICPAGVDVSNSSSSGARNIRIKEADGCLRPGQAADI